MLNINALDEPGTEKAVNYLNKASEGRASEGTSSCSLFRKQENLLI
jgi:hypothetical protein